MTRMVRKSVGSLVAMVLLATLAGSAHAQRLTLGTGAGVTIPVGDFGDAFNSGWNAQGNLGITSPTWPVGLRFDFVYHSLDDDAGPGPDNDLTIISGLANLELKLNPRRSDGLSLVVGPGVYNFEEEFGVGETDIGLFGGASYRFATPTLVVSLEGKFHNVFQETDPAQFANISLVVHIPFGVVSASRTR